MFGFLLVALPIEHYFDAFIHRFVISEKDLKEATTRGDYKRERKLETTMIRLGLGSFHGPTGFEYCYQCSVAMREYNICSPGEPEPEPCIECQTLWVQELEYQPATRMFMGFRCGHWLLWFAVVSILQNSAANWWKWNWFLAKFLPDVSRDLTYVDTAFAVVFAICQIILWGKIIIDFQRSKSIRYFWYLDRWLVGRYSIMETPIWERVYAILPLVVLVYLAVVFEASELEFCFLIAPMFCGVQISVLEFFHLISFRMKKHREEWSEVMRVVDRVDREEKMVGEKPVAGLRED